MSYLPNRLSLFSRIVLFLLVLMVSSKTVAGVSRFNNKKVHTKLFVELPGYGVDVQSKTSNRQVQWRPNSRTSSGVGISINGFVGFSISGKGNSENTQYKGDTEYSDYRITYNPENFYLSLSYMSYKGFYVENSKDIDPAYLNSQSYIQSRKMSIENYSANFIYVFDPKNFSVTAALDQVHRQDSTGGSWLAGLSATKISYYNPDTFIPLIVRSEFGEDQNTTNFDFTSYTIKGGYGFTLVPVKNWYATLMAMVGLGVQSGTHKDAAKEHTTSRTASSIDLWLSLGYSGDEYFGGALFKDEVNGYQTDTMNISAAIYTFGFFAGARF